MLESSNSCTSAAMPGGHGGLYGGGAGLSDAMRARLASRMTAASNAAAATPRRSNSSSSSEMKAQQRAAAPTAAAKH